MHDHNTRAKCMFRVSLGTQTFSTVSARIWNPTPYLCPSRQAKQFNILGLRAT